MLIELQITGRRTLNSRCDRDSLAVWREDRDVGGARVCHRVEVGVVLRHIVGGVIGYIPSNNGRIRLTFRTCYKCVCVCVCVHMQIR